MNNQWKTDMLDQSGVLMNYVNSLVAGLGKGDAKTAEALAKPIVYHFAQLSKSIKSMPVGGLNSSSNGKQNERKREREFKNEREREMQNVNTKLTIFLFLSLSCAEETKDLYEGAKRVAEDLQKLLAMADQGTHSHSVSFDISISSFLFHY
jgi:hypothetical protein